jgi:transcriptional regulator with XRE-family HTH domain
LVDKNKVQDKYSRAKAVLKSLNVDQYALADKLGIKQGPVSLALNGKNEKTFLRIVALLEKEYGIIPADIFDDPQTMSQGLQEQLAEIKGDLKRVLEELEAIKAKMAGGVSS